MNMSNPFAHLLQQAMHTAADIRQVYKAGESMPGDRPREAGTKCTPCAAAAYVENARKGVQKYRG